MARTRTSRTSFRDPVEGLVDLARSAREDSLPEVLEAVAAAVAETCHFQTVALNVFRPAWNDYEAVLVRGGAPVARALVGTRISAEEFRLVIGDERPRLPGTYFLTASSAGWRDIPHSYTPPIPLSSDPDAWQAEDGLIVALSDTGGTPLGFLSVDEPADGRRPSDDDLRLLRAICSHAEQALESARQHRQTAESAQLSAQMLSASAQIVASVTAAELTTVASDTIAEHLGFERVAIYQRLHGATLTLVATRGWESRASLDDPLPLSRVNELLAGENEHAGTWLLAAEALFPGVSPTGRSRRNGRGPMGWDDSCMLVPVREATGDLAALIVAEDPRDHALPSDQRRNQLRLLAEQVSAMWTTLRLREVHQRLLGLVLVREGAAALAQALAETIRAPVALLDWSGQVIARAAHDGRQVAIPPREQLAAVDPAQLIVRPLELGNEVEGYLVVEGSDRPQPIREMAVEQAVTSFALQLVLLSNAEEVEHRVRGDLIDELLDSATVDLEALRRRTGRLGQDLDRLTAAIAVEPSLVPEPVGERSGFTHLARIVRAVLDAAGCGSIIAPRAGSVLALITDPAGIGHRELGEQLVREAQRRMGAPVSVGISRAISDPSGLAQAVRDAQQSLRAARSLPRLASVALAGELELRELLLSAPRDDEIQRAARRLLAPLIEAGGRTRGAELLTTLQTYLEVVGHLESAARQLGIHINTLRHRIARIEELLGRDLREARTRVDLQLALELVDPRSLSSEGL